MKRIVAILMAALFAGATVNAFAQGATPAETPKAEKKAQKAEKKAEKKQKKAEKKAKKAEEKKG